MLTVKGGGAGAVYAHAPSGPGLEALWGSAVVVPTVAFAAHARGVQVEHRLELPVGARLDRATFVVGASPAGGSTLVSSVAQVRASEPSAGDGPACVVDFGRLVTVAGITPDPSSDVVVTSVHGWSGTAWVNLGTDGFPERSTERLLVGGQGGSSVDLAEALSAGTVAMPAQPSSLELLVDGNTVWFDRQGSAADVPTPDLDASVVYAVDRTEAVRDAVERARVIGGMRTVAVTLRAATPGELTLRPSVSMLFEHLVQFGADALSRTVEAPSETLVTVPLAGPGADGAFAAGDTLRALTLTARGTFGRERVQPVTGPELEDEVSLVLGPGRVVLLGLPRVLTRRLRGLTGVRVHLTSRDRGCELAGRLLGTGDAGAPGSPVDGGRVPPLTVAPRTSGWTTLALGEAVEPPPGDGEVTLWMELTSTYGEAELALTSRGPGDARTPGAPARRRLPGGGTVAFAQIDAFGPLYAAVRLVGTPAPAEPLPAVEVSLAGALGSVGANPSGDPLAVSLLPEGGHVPAQGIPLLHLAIAAPGSVTVSDVRILYSTGAAP